MWFDHFKGEFRQTSAKDQFQHVTSVTRFFIPGAESEAELRAETWPLSKRVLMETLC